MGFNRIEWTDAQELLLKLAQLLAPLEGNLGEGKSTFSFSNRLFVPKQPNSKSSEPFPYPVRILPILQDAQTKIAQWIDSPAAAKQQNPVKIQEPPTGKRPVASTQRQDNPGAGIEKRSQGAEAPILGRVQVLVKQVRISIQNLSNSTFIETPHQMPLQTVLKKLKPLVDALIEAIEEGSLDPHQEGSSLPFRNAIPRTAREEALHKRSFPVPIYKTGNSPKLSGNVEKQDAESGAKIVVQKEKGESKILSEPSNQQDRPFPQSPENRPAATRTAVDAYLSDRLATHYSRRLQERKEESSSSISPSIKTPPASAPFEGRLQALAKRKEGEESAKQEKAALPAASYYPGAIPFPSRQIEKKKRKRLFGSFREEEDDGDPEHGKR